MIVGGKKDFINFQSRLAAHAPIRERLVLECPGGAGHV